MYQRMHKSLSENSQTQQKSSQIAPRSFDVEAQHNFSISPSQSENDSWVERREKASQLGHNIANIPVSSPHKGSAIQANLTTSESGDEYEEADSVAANNEDVKVEIDSLTPGQLLGYKGTVLEPEAKFQWPPPKDQSDKDWAGIYVGSEEEAKGYLVPIFDDATGSPKPSKGYLAEIVLKKDLKRSLQLFHVKGKYMTRSDIPEETKAKKVKEKSNISEKEPLIPSIGKENMIYKGGSLEENGKVLEEIVIPHNLAEYTEVKKVKEYTYQQLKNGI